MQDTTSVSGTSFEVPVRFVGSGSEFFRIWIVNLLLILVTLGLYYPFAKVRRLRYFYAATEVGGSPLSFHGDPWKMFRGYLLVALMLAVYSAAGHFSATAGGVAFLIVAALWPALWHSSMRFRLANTGWRGLRFHYTGTRGGAYAAMGVPLGVAMLFVLAALLLPETMPTRPTLPGPDDPQPAPAVRPGGLAVFLAALPGLLLLLLMPLFLWLLKRLQHANYALGAQRTGFSAPLSSFYGLSLKALFVAALVGAVVVGLFMGAASLLVVPRSPHEGALLLLLPLIGLSYLLVFALVGGYWTARLQNLVWSRTASAQLRFRSVLRARALAGLWFKNTLLVLLTLGLYFPFAQVASARLRLQGVTLLSSVDLDELTASASREDESAAGEAAGDLFGFDIGL